MKKLMIIEADCNDADYVHTVQYVTDKEITFIKGIIPKLIEKDYGNGYKWENGDRGNSYEDYRDILTEEEIETFGDYVPYAEYGVHTINSIKIFDVTNETNLV